VKRDDGKLEVELERESESAGVTTKARIEGKLVSGATRPRRRPRRPRRDADPGSFTGAFSASIDPHAHQRQRARDHFRAARELRRLRRRAHGHGLAAAFAGTSRSRMPPRSYTARSRIG
jgi:hypothetical protein